MHKFRKKPVEIEALQWDGSDKVLSHLTAQGAKVKRPSCGDCTYIKVFDKTSDEWIKCPLNHYIIKGVQGEFYPCDPRIFKQTYEPVI